MGNAEVTKHSNVRHAETDYTDNTSVTTDANVRIFTRKYVFPLFNNQICAQT